MPLPELIKSSLVIETAMRRGLDALMRAERELPLTTDHGVRLRSGIEYMKAGLSMVARLQELCRKMST